METTELKAKSITTATHTFRCDDCGKVLGESEEYDDGYYDRFGTVQYKFCLDGSWYSVEKNLCNQCNDKYRDKIISALNSLGFTRSEY